MNNFLFTLLFHIFLKIHLPILLNLENKDWKVHLWWPLSLSPSHFLNWNIYRDYDGHLKLLYFPIESAWIKRKYVKKHIAHINKRSEDMRYRIARSFESGKHQRIAAETMNGNDYYHNLYYHIIMYLTYFSTLTNTIKARAQFVEYKIFNFILMKNSKIINLPIIVKTLWKNFNRLILKISNIISSNVNKICPENHIVFFPPFF